LHLYSVIGWFITKIDGCAAKALTLPSPKGRGEVVLVKNLDNRGEGKIIGNGNPVYPRSSVVNFDFPDAAHYGIIRHYR
jgi:hypothetical protein